MYKNKVNIFVFLLCFFTVFIEISEQRILLKNMSVYFNEEDVYRYNKKLNFSEIVKQEEYEGTLSI